MEPGGRVEPSQDKTKADKVDTEIEIAGSLPRAETVFEGKLNLFTEPLTERELSLLQAFTRLTTSELLKQLASLGVSGKEVARRTGLDQSHVSKASRGVVKLSADRDALIRELALQEKIQGKENRKG